MKTKKTLLLVCILLLGSVLPVVGGQSIEQTIETDDVVPTGLVYRIYLFGRVTDLVYHVEYESVNYTTFTAVRVFSFETQRYNFFFRAAGVYHYRSMPMGFPEDVFEFHGILGNRFVCGYFEYTDF